METLKYMKSLISKKTSYGRRRTKQSLDLPQTIEANKNISLCSLNKTSMFEEKLSLTLHSYWLPK